MLRIRIIVIFSFLLSMNNIYAQNEEQKSITINMLAGDSIPPYTLPGIDSGAEVDIIRAIFKTKNINVTFTFVPLKRVSSDVDLLKADGSTRMVQNEKNVKGFYTRPYITYQGCVLTLQSVLDYKNISVLENKSIIAFQGASERFGEEFKKMTELNHEYHEMNNQLKQVTLLLSKKTDAIVSDLLITRYFIKQNEQNLNSFKITDREIKCNILLHNSPFPAFFKEQHTVDQFNDGLTEIKKNGVYDKILKQYNVKPGE